jgi:mRNA-degrading endonuclease RelE of RelBE toxin-antitoxin system
VSTLHAEHPEAGVELFAAAQWYERQEPGLGHALFAAIDDALDAIDESPESWAVFPGWRRLPAVRSKRTHQFPYRVVYVVLDEEPVILAYAHERRRPRYWAHRVEDMLNP